MSPPAPRINTFMNVASKPNIDIISKIFIIAELLFGANRLLVVGVKKKLYILMTIGYSAGLYSLFLYLIQRQYNTILFQFIMITDFIQFLLCNILAFIFQRRLINYYIELNKFDVDIGYEAENPGKRKILQNFLQIIITIFLSIIFYCISDERNNNVLLVLLPMKLLHCFELHYYGHLFILIIPRIKLITNYIKISYPNKNNDEHEIEDTAENVRRFKRRIRNVFKIEMKGLIIFYNRIIIAFDFLYESMKWQILIFIVIIFTISLNLSFNIAKSVIVNEYTVGALSADVSFCLIELLPLLAPCIYGEKVCCEVRILRDLLSSRIYENVLDKSSRSSARSLLALMEARNLSFSLLHMFEIDITLPFKFMGLLFTYLIILLQFDKVINPN